MKNRQSSKSINSMGCVQLIYEALRRMSLVSGQCMFSDIFLGKSRRYYSFLLAKKKAPPVHVLIFLAARLEALAERVRYRHPEPAREIRRMALEVRDEAEHRSLIAVPYRHHRTPPIPVPPQVTCM